MTANKTTHAHKQDNNIHRTKKARNTQTNKQQTKTSTKHKTLNKQEAKSQTSHDYGSQTRSQPFMCDSIHHAAKPV